MTFGRVAELASWRARECPPEITCLALFGVGGETLQRIESGEIVPEPDIEARILAVLDQQLPPPPREHAGGSLGAGGVVARRAAGVFGGAPVRSSGQSPRLSDLHTHANRGALSGRAR